jgi:hypothetical protein
MKKGKLRSVVNERHTRVGNFAWNIELVEESFVRKLTNSFPKDDRRIQEFIMKSGYDSKEKCRDLLLRTVGRGTEVKHLYRGLPSEEKTKNKLSK